MEWKIKRSSHKEEIDCCQWSANEYHQAINGNTQGKLWAREYELCALILDLLITSVEFCSAA